MSGIKTISLLDAFRMAKEMFGKELEKEGVSDDKLKAHLSSAARTDREAYEDEETVWDLWRSNMLIECDSRDLSSYDAYFSCRERATSDELGRCDDILKRAEEKGKRCTKRVEDTYKRRVSDIAEKLGSNDEKTISLYDAKETWISLARCYLGGVNMRPLYSKFREMLDDK